MPDKVSDVQYYYDLENEKWWYFDTLKNDWILWTSDEDGNLITHSGNVSTQIDTTSIRVHEVEDMHVDRNFIQSEGSGNDNSQCINSNNSSKKVDEIQMNKTNNEFVKLEKNECRIENKSSINVEGNPSVYKQKQTALSMFHETLEMAVEQRRLKSTPNLKAALEAPLSRWKSRIHDLAAKTRENHNKVLEKLKADDTDENKNTDSIKFPIQYRISLNDLIDQVQQNSDDLKNDVNIPGSLLDSAGTLPSAFQGDIRERRRRTTGFAGGQGRGVRFGTSHFRDPNLQLQLNSLLTSTRKRQVADHIKSNNNDENNEDKSSSS